MPLAVVRGDATEASVDDLPLAAIDALERETGRSVYDLPRTAKGAALLAGALVGDVNGLPWSALRVVMDDRPTGFEDGLPVDGGRTADRFIVMFGRPPFCWPPDVVLRQTMRSLLLLIDGSKGWQG